jgi:hypothetical protein
MVVATHSNEGKLRTAIEELGCAENSFALFNGVVGRTRFFEAMRGQPGKHFSAGDVKQLFEVIGEMTQLQNDVGDVPIDWSRADKIQTVLTICRVSRIAKELGVGDSRVDAVAARVTKDMSNGR